MRRLLVLLSLLALLPTANAALVNTGATTYASSSTDSSFSLNLPASVSIGDLLLAQINYGSTGIAITPPSGWTKLREDTNSSDHQYLYYRFAVAGDTPGAATSWNLSGKIRVAASLSGVHSDLGRTIVLGTNAVNTGSGSTLSGGSLSATAIGELLRFFGMESGNNPGFTLSGNLTQLAAATSSNTSSGASIATASHAIGGAGSTGADTASTSLSTNWIVQSLLLTEAPLAKPTTCYTDSFSNTSTFSQNWVTTSVGTTAFTPTITGGLLELTSDTGYISTGATLQRLFPTTNLIYVEFNAYSYPNSSGADGIAVTLSDASITPQPGGFGGSLGYAQRTGINGFAGGWLGAAIDDYGNYSNPTEGRIGGPGFYPDAVAIRGSGSGQNGYAYVAGTAANLNPSVDSSSTSPAPGYRYRFIIDAAAAGQTYVTVDRDTTGSGNSYANLIPTFNIAAASGQAALPANLMLTLTGSTGGSSNIHEIGNLSVCATNIQPVNQVDHFQFQYNTPGLTCEPSSVTILACANAACSTLMPGTTTVTLNPANGWVGGNTVQLVNGTATVQLNQPTAGTATLSVASSSPGAKPFSQYVCNGVSSASCSLPFNNAGLSFTVPNVTANKPSGAVTLRAVRNSGDATNSCVALFQNSKQNINFWSGYTTPSSGTIPVELRPGSGSGAFTSISGASPGTPLTLTFDSNGQTTFELRYQDAGLMALNAQYNGSGTYAGLVLSGTDSFVSSPAGFCIRAPVPGSSPATYYSCTSNFASCPVIAAAGNPFTLNISAVNWDIDGDTDFCTSSSGSGNVVTPNYAQNSLTLGSQFGLTSAQFAPPPTGTASNGALSPATVNITAGGTVSLSNATESEVGAFNFTVSPPAYFGVSIPASTSAIIGRFTPHHFAIPSGSALINRSSCSTPPAFTYLGEPLTLTYQVNALNAGNVVTQNYQGIFATLLTYKQSNTTAIATGPALTALAVSDTTNGQPNLFSWINGQSSVTSPVMVAKGTAPVGPYTGVVFGIATVDSDNVGATGFNLDTDVPAVTPVVFDHVQIGNATELLYGRLSLDSVAGPANLPLPLPVTAQYWNGSAFVTNTSDTNCTAIASTLGTLSSYQGQLSAGETTLSGSGTITNGQLNALQLSAPGANISGSVNVTLDLTYLPWLQFDWNGDGSLDTSVTGTASFGLYRGSDRVIYWRETP